MTGVVNSRAALPRSVSRLVSTSGSESVAANPVLRNGRYAASVSAPTTARARIGMAEVGAEWLSQPRESTAAASIEALLIRAGLLTRTVLHSKLVHGQQGARARLGVVRRRMGHCGLARSVAR